MIPQAKSFFAVRKIPGTKKNVLSLVRRLAVSPRPASPGLVATPGAVLQNVAATTESTEPTDKSTNYLPLHY